MVKNVEALPAFLRFVVNNIRLFIFIILTGLYVLAFCLIKVRGGSEAAPIVSTEAKIVKLVDVQEYVPPPPTNVIQVEEQPVASEVIQETDEVIEQEAPKTNVVEANQSVFAGAEGDGIEYLPQHKITDVPVVPTKEVLSRIVYPSMAHKQGIEGVVYLELYIDDEGTIRDIKVLKDPGHGFAEAAVAAFEGLKCEPAKQNGKAVPVRFRYPVRFSLK